MTGRFVVTSGIRSAANAALVLAALLLVAALFTWPLLPLRSSHVAGDPGDPILNASILWWTSTTVPLTEAWWNPPYFYPTKDVMSFSENLLGISPIASPVYWLTGSPLTAYNIALYLAWPLSGFALYLLVRFLTSHEDAAIIAGFAFGFSPYRTHELGHIQMASSYWIPLVLLGLHGYLRTRRSVWLLLFACSWVLQSLANMYMLLFCGVLISLWLLYFCSSRAMWRAGAAILVTWIVASAPLVPILLRYRQAHHTYGLARSLGEPFGFSLPPAAWLQVAQHSVLWRHFMPDQENLFPGIVPPALVLAGLCLPVLGLRRRDGWTPSRAGALLWAVLIASAAAAFVTVVVGPWRVSAAGLSLHVSDLDRALIVGGAATALLLARSSRFRSAFARRDPWLFYTVGIGFFALCTYGPVIRVGRMVVSEHGPYWWLMHLPGFDGLRVPFRIWMLGVLCLCLSAGYAFASLPFRSAHRRRLAFALVCLALTVDTWARIPMAPVPDYSRDIAALSGSGPLIEIPLGPDHDGAATFRSIGHRRAVVNGVSGYDPPHYAPLIEGLDERDPMVLLALASFGALDIAVHKEADRDADVSRYVSHVSGVVALRDTDAWQLYRLARSETFDAAFGARLPIRVVRAFAGDASAIIDGRADTFWRDLPQRSGQWIVADLGDESLVAGISHTMGTAARDFPRRLAIDLSVDGNQWTEVFHSRMAGWAVRGAILDPRNADMRIAFSPRPARYVRLRQTASHRNYWLVAELSVFAPPAR